MAWSELRNRRGLFDGLNSSTQLPFTAIAQSFVPRILKIFLHQTLRILAKPGDVGGAICCFPSIVNNVCDCSRAAEGNGGYVLEIDT
jgi:hypothetical protein